MLGHDQRLLVPKTDEKRGAPCVEPAGDAGGGGALRGGGAGGAVRGGGEAGVGRSYDMRCGALAGVRAGVGGAGARVRSAAAMLGRAAPSPLRDDIRRNSSRNGQLAFSAATCAHSISAQFLASRRCAFMSPSR
jgi:hypothetical protein